MWKHFVVLGSLYKNILILFLFLGQSISKTVMYLHQLIFTIVLNILVTYRKLNKYNLYVYCYF